MNYITWLRDAEGKTATTLGGKAHSIAQLAAAGFPIAEGFVLHPAALVDSWTAQQELAVVGRTANAVGTEPVEPPQTISEAVSQELTAALARLCLQGERVAVRSSALSEDGRQQSFAGQLDSFLQVEPELVSERVLAVWRSAFSERVLAYSQEHHLAGPPTPPAVLIQRMVDPDVAGVAFAADPVSGRRSVTVIHAVAGLADQLVQGNGESDCYQVERTGKIWREANAQLLTDEQLEALTQLVRQVSDYLGQPQDVEWALTHDYSGDHWTILQSRPITTLEQRPDPDGTFCLWDNSNIVESYNGITTPLTFSFARKAYEEVYKQFCGFMGVPVRVINQNQHIFRCMIGLIQGRIYYNLLSWYRMLALLPGTRVNARFMEQMMGVRETLPEQVVIELQQALKQNWPLDGWRLLMTLISFVVNFFTLPGRIRRYYRRLALALELRDTVDRPADLTTWRADELVAHYRALEQNLLPHWDAPLITDFFAMIFYGLLRRCTEDWCGDGSWQNDLIGGEGGVISAEPWQRMQAMAHLIHDHSDWIELLCQGTVAEIGARLPEIPDFQQQYESYLERFGDRCLEELKLESPTLHDDPLPLLRSIGQLAQRQRSSTRTAENASTERRHQAEQRVNQALQGHPLRQVIFAWILRNARIQVRNRENLRFERTRVFGRARRIFLELGKRLFQVDRLSSPQQVFYLEVNELLGFVEGNLTCTDLKGLVALRQAEFNRYRQEASPAQRFETWGMVYQGNAFQPNQRSAKGKAAVGETPNVQQGVCCSPGQVQGVVRVISHSKQALEQGDRPFEPGCILVAESSDPGWILLFPHAAGLLVERGSVLSHVAIVCRELGIPMITSLPKITQWLQDGELVRLDGTTGRVEKLRATS